MKQPAPRKDKLSGHLRAAKTGLTPNPLWYKEAIIYEIPIRAFADSDGDGIGDLNGVISKLDYLQDLGVTALWLLPFYPSPLRDGGYDISDYMSVHPMYGTLADFKRLLREAHARGIRIITELVINHTSKDHPWFQRSRMSPPGSKWRNFYVWSEDPSRYGETRIIFKDFETSNWTWDAEAKAYYWHRFYSHQPDLNFDNPEVHKAVLKALDFWLELGVDGLRLDAIPYLYERDQTHCENLPETHAFLKKLRAHVDARFYDRMLLAEANQWPEDAAAYFGAGDECHMNFHFPLMPRMFMAVQMEDRFPIVDILNQTPPIPEGCQWATFLRNHDELTLEMVTDEDRDYMYKVYAEDPTARLNLGIRRRLAPLLKTRPQIELMNALLFSLPGTPVLYYGDEIGMGDNIYLGDRDGVRTPMQWSADRNAGFSSANPQKLFLPVVTDPEYSYAAVNVQTQQANPSSLLWWMKRLIGLRKQYPALSSGSLEFLHPDNAKMLAFLRERDGQRVLVVTNLSRLYQWTELDLGRFLGLVPVEMAGRVRFPPIEDRPYVVSLPPYGFIWFLLEEPERPEPHEEVIPVLSMPGSWRDLLGTSYRKALEPVLERYMVGRRWFRGKARVRVSTTLSDVIWLKDALDHVVTFATAKYREGDPETYVLPLVYQEGPAAAALAERHPHAVIARLDRGLEGEGALLLDAMACGTVLEPLLKLFSRGTTPAGDSGSLVPTSGKPLREVLKHGPLTTKVPEFEQTNSTLVVGEALLFKMYRQIEPGINPEAEIGLFLARNVARALEAAGNGEDGPLPGQSPAPAVLGSLAYQTKKGEPASLVLLQKFVPNEGVAWDMTLTRLSAFFDLVLGRPEAAPPRMHAKGRVAQSLEEPHPLMQELIGPFLSQIRLLGRRTGQLHRALVGSKAEPHFVPEAFTTLHQQSIYQRAHVMLARTFGNLERAQRQLPEPSRSLANSVLALEPEIDRRLRKVTRDKIEVARIRCHGDLHLGQVLYTGQDFLIIDFEGEPARPLNERRYKRCPLRDLMGLLRSFDYACEATLRSGRFREEDRERLRLWATAWKEQVSAAVLHAYLHETEGAPFIPRKVSDTELLLEFFELEKVIYEIRYEMDNRPDWLDLPLTGMKSVMNHEGA